MKISNWTTNIANQTNDDLDWPGFTGFVAKTNQSRITRFWGKGLNSNFYLCKIYDISQLCILTFHIHCCTFTIALLLLRFYSCTHPLPLLITPPINFTLHVVLILRQLAATPYCLINTWSLMLEIFIGSVGILIALKGFDCICRDYDWLTFALLWESMGILTGWKGQQWAKMGDCVGSLDFTRWAGIHLWAAVLY